jgi:sec-independent protein translocase protein TatA
MLSRIGAPEIIIIAVLLILILGWKRLPDAARSLGRSMRVFKSEVHEMKNDGRSDASGQTVKGETVPGSENAQGTSAVREDNSPRTDNSSGAS